MINTMETMWCQNNAPCWQKNQETHWVQVQDTAWLQAEPTNTGRNFYNELVFYPAN
ncbi:MAG: hypothetical protein RL214_28 [Pseudomonadota bacterium]